MRCCSFQRLLTFGVDCYDTFDGTVTVYSFASRPENSLHVAKVCNEMPGHGDDDDNFKNKLLILFYFLKKIISLDLRSLTQFKLGYCLFYMLHLYFSVILYIV